MRQPAVPGWRWGQAALLGFAWAVAVPGWGQAALLGFARAVAVAVAVAGWGQVAMLGAAWAVAATGRSRCGGWRRRLSRWWGWPPLPERQPAAA